MYFGDMIVRDIFGQLKEQEAECMRQVQELHSCWKVRRVPECIISLLLRSLFHMSMSHSTSMCFSEN